MDSVQLVQRVKGDTMQMLLFIAAYLCPSRESIQEGPAIDCEADTAQDGYTGVLRTPESGGKQVGAPSGEDGGVIVSGGRMGSTMFGDGERFRPRENEGQEEGLYRSNKSTGEKTRG